MQTPRASTRLRSSARELRDILADIGDTMDVDALGMTATEFAAARADLRLFTYGQRGAIADVYAMAGIARAWLRHDRTTPLVQLPEGRRALALKLACERELLASAPGRSDRRRRK